MDDTIRRPDLDFMEGDIVQIRNCGQRDGKLGRIEAIRYSPYLDSLVYYVKVNDEKEYLSLYSKQVMRVSRADPGTGAAAHG